MYDLSLGAGFGPGLLTILAAQLRSEGKSVDEAADYLDRKKMDLCEFFTVDDLMFLRRTGRLSTTGALVGTMLGIKPILHVDNEGHLINMSKVRGRKASLQTMVDKVRQTSIDPASQTMAICHGDCPEDAQWIAEKLKAELNVPEVIIAPTGTVIGAHSGPGTLALFFLGTQR